MADIMCCCHMLVCTSYTGRLQDGRETLRSRFHKYTQVSQGKCAHCCQGFTASFPKPRSLRDSDCTGLGCLQQPACGQCKKLCALLACLLLYMWSAVPVQEAAINKAGACVMVGAPTCIDKTRTTYLLCVCVYACMVQVGRASGHKWLGPHHEGGQKDALWYELQRRGFTLHYR
jgi:hypothetical protein